MPTPDTVRTRGSGSRIKTQGGMPVVGVFKNKQRTTIAWKLTPAAAGAWIGIGLHSILYPIRDIRGGRDNRRTARVSATDFHIGANGRCFGWGDQKGGVETFFILKRGLLLKPVLVVQADNSHGHEIIEDDPVDIEDLAMSAPTAVTQFDLISFLEDGLLQVIVNEAGGTPQSKENRIRTFGNSDAVGVVGIESYIRKKVTASSVGLCQTAYASTPIGITPVTAPGSKVSIRTGYLGVRGEKKEVLNTCGGRVFQKILRDNLNGSRQVLQIGFDTRSSQCVGSRVARIFLGRDGERRQLENIFLFRFLRQDLGKTSRQYQHQPGNQRANVSF